MEPNENDTNFQFSGKAKEFQVSGLAEVGKC